MQTPNINITKLAGVLVALFALSGLAQTVQAAHAQFAYTNTGNHYQTQRSSFQNRHTRHHREENRVTVTIPMNGIYFNHRKTLKLKSLIKDYSQFRPRDYNLDRVVLNAAFRRAAHHQFARESYAYLKTKRLVSERKHIPYARNRHHYQRVSLNVHQAVSADDWKLYIGPKRENRFNNPDSNQEITRALSVYKCSGWVRIRQSPSLE